MKNNFTSVKGTLLLTLLTVFYFSGCLKTEAQLPWNENFDFDPGGCASQGTEADGYFSANGVWTKVDIGANTTFANEWFISATAAGSGPCMVSCTDDGTLDDQTLHIGTTGFTPDQGASYAEPGLPPGAGTTNKRVESPTIDCTGAFNIEISFDFIHGNNALDFAKLVYSEDDGATWIDIETLPNSDNTCPSPEATWTNYTNQLPASANNNPLVRIGFFWSNTNDGDIENYSVAIDNISLVAGPPPAAPQVAFSASDTLFCQFNCISFADETIFDGLSEGADSADYTWTFAGASPATSSDINPQNICYDTPGTYNVTLEITDNIGTGSHTETAYITIEDCGPELAIDASNNLICAFEECVNFTDMSTGNNVHAWNWTFEGAVNPTSSEQNPSNICYNTPGIYDVTLEATDDDATSTFTFTNYIEVIDCAGPEISFSVSEAFICVTQCVNFTDESTGNNISSWEWEFPGGNPSTSTEQHPQNICYANPGNYEVTLTSTDIDGTQTVTETAFVNVSGCTTPPEVDFEASFTDICAGDCIDFTDMTFGLTEDYLWTFQGASPLISTDQNPGIICYTEVGTYNVTLTVSNQYGVDSETKTAYINVGQCISPPFPRYEISADTVCAGECVDFTDMTSGLGVNSWQWNFQGAETQASDLQNPSGICYNQPGTYGIALTVQGAGGVGDSLFTDVITVIATPECRPEVELMIPDTMCAGTCLEFNAEIINADSVRWIFDGGIPEESTSFFPGPICYEEIGTYNVFLTAYNPSGPTTKFSSIYVGEAPLLNAGPDRVINAGQELTLTANTGGDPSGEIIWQPYDLVSDFRAATVTTSPQESTTYIVYYKEEGTCTAIDSVRVRVNFVPAVGVPSAFSPNNDGDNDELRVLGQGMSQILFRVFNRYGQMVYESNRQNEGWDGTHNGKELNPGVFVYTLEVVFSDGLRQSLKGDVTLVR